MCNDYGPSRADDEYERNDAMTGNNTIVMNQTTIQLALETYLNEHVLKSPIKVTGVKADSSSYGGASYSVTIETVPPVPPALEKESP